MIVNDRVDLALAAGAAGVHLRGDSFPAPRVKSLVPPGFVIGRSVHSEEEAAASEREGSVDYLMFGTVFPSGSKPPGHPAAGLDALRRVTAAVRVPVIAIGGITPDRVADIMAAGAAGVAAIAMFDGSDPLAPLVQRLRARV